MSDEYILFNPHAGDRTGDLETTLAGLSKTGSPQLVDMTKIKDYRAFLAGLAPEDTLILCGGDGTLNRFVNDTEGLTLPENILYYPSGTGNDFAHELGYEKGCDPFPVADYLKDLPRVTVKDRTYRFLNGVGYGIDGYCCEQGDRIKATSKKKVNYTAIAIKGLLYAFKPVNARVVVDGVARTYKKVWIAPTMHGQYYGGGMRATPNQNRMGKDGTLSLMLIHGSGKLKTLMVFPSIFKGEHVKHTHMVEVITGHEITVEFDRPTPLQIDGETILNVSSYRARSSALVRQESTVLAE